MEDKYEELLYYFCSKASITKEEAEKLIQAKIDKLNGFLTPLGAVHIIMREYGIDIPKEPVKTKKLSEAKEGDLVTVGKLQVLNIRKNDNRNSVIAKDLESNETVWISFWNDNENYSISETIIPGAVIKVENAKLGIGQKNKYLQLVRGSKVSLVSSPKVENKTIRQLLEEKPVGVFRVSGVLSSKFQRQYGGNVLNKMRVTDNTGELIIDYWGGEKDLPPKTGQTYTFKIRTETRNDYYNAYFLGYEETTGDFSSVSVSSVEDLLNNRYCSFQYLLVVDTPAINGAVTVPVYFYDKENKEGIILHLKTFSDSFKEKIMGLNKGDIVSIENIIVSPKKYLVDLEPYQKTVIKKETSIGVKEALERTHVSISNVLTMIERYGRENIETVLKAVINIGDSFEFYTKDGGEEYGGHGVHFIIADETGYLRGVAWGETAKKLIDLESGATYVFSNIRVRKDTYMEENNYQAVYGRKTRPYKSSIPIQNPVKKGSEYVEPLKTTIAEIENGKVLLKGVVVDVKKTFTYKACPNCGKKTQLQDGAYYCDSCKKQVDPVDKTIARIVLDDTTGNIVVVLFQDQLQSILGDMIRDLGDEAKKRALLRMLLNRRVFVTGWTKQTDDDETYINATDIKYVSETKQSLPAKSNKKTSRDAEI